MSAVHFPKCGRSRQGAASLGVYVDLLSTQIAALGGDTVDVVFCVCRLAGDLGGLDCVCHLDLCFAARILRLSVPPQTFT